MRKLHNKHDGAESAIEGMFDLVSLLGSLMERELSTLGVTRARAKVIWRLGRQGPMKQSELSEALGCTPRNVTGLLDALESTGLVERREHPDDRRASLVTLTSRGAAASAAWTTGHRSMSERIFAGTNLADLEAFVRVLDQVRGRLRDTTTVNNMAKGSGNP